MKIPININIKSERIYGDIGPKVTPPEPEMSDVCLHGYIKKTKQGLQVEYKESEESGMGDTTTTISLLDDNIVSVNRIGELNSIMIFEKGKAHNCIYNNGFFQMQMKICTNSLHNSLSLHGGKIDIDYTVEIVGNVAEKNRLSVSIYPQDEHLTS